MPTTAQKVRAERPIFAVLDQWLRSDGAYRLQINACGYLFVAAPDREIRLTRDLAIARVRRGKDQEVYEYIEQQVTRKSRSVGGNQHPMMKGDLEGPLPLVKVGSR